MDKVMEIKKAIGKIKSGDTVMIGGFANNGAPLHLIYELAEHREIKNLTTICEGFGYDCDPPVQQGRLLAAGQIREIIVSFLGGNDSVTRAVEAGEVKLTLVPQGTLAERIRAAGAGIGGFYTQTGVGTVVEEGKETREINGRKYLLEMPLKAEVALVKCHTADRMGNAVFRYTARNFNPLMAMAADYVILECEHLVEIGEIEPDAVQLPGVFVDAVVLGGEVLF